MGVKSTVYAVQTVYLSLELETSGFVLELLKLLLSEHGYDMKNCDASLSE